MSFKTDDILYEDNHLLVVNKKAGQLVQADTSGDLALEDEIKAFIKVRDNKPGNVFLGVVHRIDRPVSGVILFAKSKKALVRRNEMMKKRALEKHYWAITENRPAELEALLVHQLMRDGKTNKSYVVATPRGESKEARLRYKVLNISDRYTLVDVELLTGRHHQIRCQLSKIGCPIRGDLKYGAKRSLPNGSISLHSRSLTFVHPVRNESMTIVAPVPKDDNLWRFFEQNNG
jgi:23S rRNA pseudouridine1911/1915/1917 synthase